jgi:hypothetical protein
MLPGYSGWMCWLNSYDKWMAIQPGLFLENMAGCVLCLTGCVWVLTMLAGSLCCLAGYALAVWLYMLVLLAGYGR